MMDIMAQDTLFLLSPGFEDAKYPGTRFVCPSCNQIEGLLRSFPDLAAKLTIHRVDFPRPRQQVIDVVGEEHQALPLLVFGENPPEDATTYSDTHFIQDTKRILTLLAERHGFPQLH
ncbi:hypothetical protein B7W85_24055 [Allorhizobium ampelinum]|nr:DUF3088 domain-containing protein [Allorhizobium ampelinum]OVE88527.1 hypothetical protein B7W85_24055 [Allorhizobium ampelinum]